MASFLLASLAASAAVVTHAALRRGGPYAVFGGVLTLVHSACATGVHAVLVSAAPAPLRWGFYALHGAVYAHLFLLGRPRWKPRWYRNLVAVPSQALFAGCFLAWPFAVAAGLGAPAALLSVPFAFAAAGLYESLSARREVTYVDLGAPLDAQAPLRRAPAAPASAANPAEALRVVQLTDTHLGPFMSVERLRGFVERAVAHEPDLVLLTGDFLTMESQGDAGLLRAALEPLRPLADRVFACMGNHDHEAPRVVRQALEALGIKLLVDELATVATRLGPVEVLGYDFRFRDRAAHLASVSARFPRREGVPRLALLHDPGAFAHLPDGAADVVFSGHTHGGQLGLLRLGAPHTFVSTFTKIPDHGHWTRGAQRLYVHRGTGHYGFPLRIGVPAEESLLWLRLAPRGEARPVANEL